MEKHWRFMCDKIPAPYPLQNPESAPDRSTFLAITLATAHLRMGQGLHLAWCYFFPTQIILNWVQFVRSVVSQGHCLGLQGFPKSLLYCEAFQM